MDQIIELKNELKKVQTKMDDIHYALIGNPITKDGGLVYRVIEGEVQIQRLNDRVDEIKRIQDDKITELEKKGDRSDIYVKIIWGCAGVFLSAFVIGIINLFFK